MARHRSDKLTLEDVVRVCHRYGMRVNFMALPDGYEKRERTSRWRGMTPTRLSLIQRGFHVEGMVPLAAAPFSSWSKNIQTGMKLRRLAKLGKHHR